MIRRMIQIALLLPLPLMAQGTYTAASASYTDVNAVINGPTHTAVNGDIIQIPCSGSNSVTWSSSLIVNANITLTALGATPNTGPSTFGAGTNCLTITLASQYGIQINPTYNATNSLNISTLSNMTLDPGTGATSAIYVQGTGAAGGMPLINLNNIQFGDGTTQWKVGTTGEFPLLVNNVFGVVHHSTLVNGSQVAFISVNLTSYLGVGLYGDNSWAQPDTYGSANELYIENNVLYQGGWPVVENEFPFPNIGGGRAVTRFNQINPSNGATGGLFFITGGHGLDTDGRDRSMRTNETYGNTVAYAAGTNGYDFCSYRGGTGLCWGNTVTFGAGASLKDFVGLSTYRTIGDTLITTGFNGCGDAASGQAQGPFDGNDGTSYFSGTAGASSSGLTVVDSGSPGWTTNQWSNPGDNYPYYVWNVTKGWVTTITSNTSNSLTAIGCNHGIVGGGGCSTFNFSSGDSYQIRRSKWCTDGMARGQGALIQGFPAVLQSTGSPGSSAEALDPVYEWDDTAPALSPGPNVTGGGPQGNVTYALINREYFTDNSLGSPTAQTSPTSPFNGATGVGFGTLANRPTTCTTGAGGAPGVFYFATDQGSWNTSGNGFGSGLGYHCTATNTWTQDYTPDTYPYSLAGGGGGTTFSFTVAQSGTGFGSLSGCSVGTITVNSGYSFSCTVAPWVGSTFAWSGVAGCSTAATCSGTVTANTTLALTLTAGTGPVVDAQATNGVTPGSTISIATTTGHAVYLGFYDGNASGDTLTATDSQSNTWTFSTTGNMPTSGNTLGIGCAVASSTGTLTITAKAGGATGNWHLTAYDVINSSCTPDVVATPAYYTSATTCTGNALTTTVTNDFLFGECGLAAGGGTQIAAGTNWLNPLNAGFTNAGSNFYNQFSEAQLAASTGSYTATSGTTPSGETLVLTTAYLSSPTCGNPSQLGPNFSGTYPSSSTPLSIGFTSPTPGCSMFMTLNGTTPTCLSTAYAGQNITTTTTMRVIACQTGYTSSAVAGGTWTITGAANFTFTASATNGTINSTNNCATNTSPGYASGTMIGPCTATPNTGYAFSSWTGTGSAPASSTTNPLSFSIAVNSTLTANFTQLPVATPVATPGAGTYPSPRTVALSTTTSGATIKYGTSTVPGACTPSTTYTTPVVLNVIPIEYLCAYGTATGYAQSSTATFQYVLIAAPVNITGQVTAQGQVNVK